MNKKRNSTFKNTLIRMFMGSKHTDELSILEEEQMASPLRTVISNFLEIKLAMFGLCTFTLIFLACFIIPIFKPLNVSYNDYTQANVSPGFNMMSVPTDLKNDLAVLSAGATYGAGADNSGEIYVYGNLSDQKLKDNIPDNMGIIVDISAGYNHIVALNEDGELFSWGYDRLGVTDIPAEVKELEGNIIEIDAGYMFSYLVTDLGEVLYWGNLNLMEITGLDTLQGSIDQIEFNSSTGIALTDDGYVHFLSKIPGPLSYIPEEIQGDVIEIALSEKTAVAVLTDGSLVSWGELSHASYTIPESAEGLVFSVVEGGRNHFTALTQDGSVISWGENNYGQTDVPASVENIETIVTDYHQNYAFDEDGNMYTWGLKGHLMGTDSYGRDVFLRLVSGGRMSLTVGAIAVVISTIIGVLVGGIAGYYGGTIIDDLLMRFAEIVGGLPFIPLAMILTTILGSSVPESYRIVIIMIILGVLGWTGLARITRAQILAEREKEFVTAAKAIGVKESKIIFKHIMPNIIAIIIVSVTLNFASSMLTEAGLSYLGFGVSEPNPTWGNMLYGAQDSKIIATYWWQWVFPALALSFCTISINSVGDGLRDAIDPHSNDR